MYFCFQFLLFFAKDLVGNDAARLNATFDHAVRGLPTASGGLSRLAVNRVRRAGIRVEPLLSRAGLTIDQVDDPEKRIDAGSRLLFLQLPPTCLTPIFLALVWPRSSTAEI